MAMTSHNDSVRVTSSVRDMQSLLQPSKLSVLSHILIKFWSDEDRVSLRAKIGPPGKIGSERKQWPRSGSADVLLVRNSQPPRE